MSRYQTLQQTVQAQPAHWLVTGGAGFIGSNIAETLLRWGQRVTILDNLATGYEANVQAALTQSGAEADRLAFIEGDIRDLETCRRACEGVDYVIHQAALGSVPRSIADPITSNDSNVNGFLNMLVGARDAEAKRFVYASSSSVYGDHPGLPKVEDQTGTPLSPYAITKAVNELYAQTFAQHYGLETVGLRYFNVFGPRQDPDGPYAAVIPKWIGQMLSGERCFINGDGETSRDFCYVANAVQANLLAATQPEAAGRVYNVAYGERTTLNELHAVLREGLATYAPQVIETPEYREFRAGDVRHSLADISAAQERMGYAPTHSATEGLTEAMGWYAEHNAVRS